MTQRYRISGIVAGVVYDVRVRGKSGLVRGAWAESNSNNSALDVTAPAAPTGLTATGVIRGIALNWSNPVDVDLKWVEVWEATAALGTYTKVGATGGTAFLRSGLMPATSLWFKLRAVDASGNASAYTAAVQGTASLLLVDDIADGILNTAKFAAGIKPVAVPATAGELSTLRTADQIIFPQSAMTDSVTAQALDAQRLYRWNGSQWVAVVSAAEISGQITSDQVASLAAAKVTGQITQTQITDGAISTPKLAAGAVTTATLAAGAVTTNKLAVVPQTLNVDPYFQDPSAWFFPAFGSGWNAENAAPGNAPSNLGVPRAGVLFDGNWTGTGESAVVSTFTIPVTVGERLAVKARGVNFGNRTIYAGINYHNAANAYLSSLSVVWEPGTGFSDKETQGVVPANAAYAHVVLYVGSGAAWSGWAAISAVTVFRPATASMVVDGAITADKIATNAITADKVSANAITVGKIAAGAISSAQIAAGEIKAVNLASETLITQAGQLGSAVIGTAQIQDLSVGTLKVANNAITETTGASWNGPSTDGSFVDLAIVYFSDGAAQRYLIQASLLGTGGAWFQSGGESDIFKIAGFSMRLLLNGSTMFDFPSNATGTIFYGQTQSLGAGSYELKLQGRVFEPQPGGVGTLNNALLSVTKVKK